jgi:hypothetical protein
MTLCDGWAPGLLALALAFSARAPGLSPHLQICAGELGLSAGNQ